MTQMQSHASDGAFVAAKGSAAEGRDIYFRSTDGAVRYFDGSVWTSLSASNLTETLTGKTIDAAVNTVILPPQGNFLINGAFDFWQRGTSFTVANVTDTYCADRWHIRNSLGTGGVITVSRQTGTEAGSKYACKLLITTAPTASHNALGCALSYVLENLDSLRLYNQTASFSIKAKAFGNTTQIGVQFWSSPAEEKLSAGGGTMIGVEQYFTINSAGYTTCNLNGQALGTGIGAGGSFGIRIRATGVSSGTGYDLNNGFQVEQAMLNLGNTAAVFQRAGRSAQDELAYCQRYYEKSYDLGTVVGTSTAVGAISEQGSVAGTQRFPVKYSTRKRIAPTTVKIHSTAAAGSVDRAYNESIASDVLASVVCNGESGFAAAVTSAASGQLFSFHFVSDAEI